MESIHCKIETQNQIKQIEYEKFFRDIEKKIEIVNIIENIILKIEKK